MVKAEIIVKRTTTLETRVCTVESYPYEGDTWICPFCEDKNSHISFVGMCSECGAEVQVIATKEITHE